MDENIKCPICHQPAKIGYACGDYFMHCSDGCPSPMCDHPTESVTLASWLDWVKWYNCNQPDNNPLALDELREMDGEPVWESWTGSWRIVTKAHDGETASLYNAYNSISAKSVLYNDGRIYRSRPGRNK